jgi:hypothetical protein
LRHLQPLLSYLQQSFLVECILGVPGLSPAVIGVFSKLVCSGSHGSPQSMNLGSLNENRPAEPGGYLSFREPYCPEHCNRSFRAEDESEQICADG